jgi:putative transcriptional regulator
MSHHPSEHRLMEYAAGAMSDGPALCIAVHLESCLHCSRKVEEYSHLGAALMEESSQVSDDLFDKVMAGVEAGVESIKQLPQTLLEKLLPADINALDWKRIGVGVYEYVVNTGDGDNSVKLLRVDKGRSVFQHTHTGTEFTMLLQGGYSDELGNYRAGDFIECDASHKHKPIAIRDEDCILLTAVSGNLRFTGPLSRLLNPFYQF